MPRTRSPLVTLAACAGILTIVTAVLFARMPDTFVSQFGWFIIVLGPIGGSMLIGTALWYRSGWEPRAAAAVMATLAFGDFLFNAAALRAASLGVIPSPDFLHGLTAAASIILAICALWSSYAAPATARPGVRWAAALMLAGASIGAAVAFEGMVFRALEPHRAAVEACNASTAKLERSTCVAREEAKPLSTRGFLVGLGGFGATALGLGALVGARRGPGGPTRTSALASAVAIATVLGVGSLVVAASIGVADLNRLHEGCRPTDPMRQTRARVISVEEQTFRDCVVSHEGTNPWAAPFWNTFATGLSVLFGAAFLSTASVSVREGTRADSA